MEWIFKFALYTEVDPQHTEKEEEEKTKEAHGCCIVAVFFASRLCAMY